MLQEAIRNFYAGNLAQAEIITGSLLRSDPNNPDALHLKAAIALQLGQLKEAEKLLEEALKYRESDPNFYNTLATILRGQRKFEEATKASKKAMALIPRNPHFINNLGLTYVEEGDHKNAEICYKQVLQIAPNFAESLMNLGILRINDWRLEEALEYLDKAAQLMPGNALTWHNLSCAYRFKLDFENAIIFGKRALQMDPRQISIWAGLAETYFFQGDYENAVKIYDEAIKSFPNHCGLRVQRACIMPHILESNEQIDKLRAEFSLRIDEMTRCGVKLDNTNYIILPFYQGYHGRDNKEFMIKLREFFRQAMPVLNYVAPHSKKPKRRKDGKIKIGIISKYLFDHAIGTFYRPLIYGLAENPRFEVVPVIISTRQDEERKAFEKRIKVLNVPTILDKAIKAIADEEFDIILHLEVGLDLFPYLLASMRFAPIQCVMAGGHPITSGLDTLDYTLSSKLIEPENGHEHYVEKMVPFNRFPFAFKMPKVPEGNKSRKELNLPEGRLYACPVFLFRIHPDMDPIFIKILDHDEKAKIILFDSENRHKWKELLEKRFDKTVPAHLRDRVIIVPFAKGDNLIMSLRHMDAILDAFHFSMGTTAYKIFADGMPIVTWPGEFMRGRASYALYQMMGIMDVVARDHYDFAEIAVRIATDKKFREEISEKIKAKSHLLFDDDPATDEVTNFFIDIYEKTFPNEERV